MSYLSGIDALGPILKIMATLIVIGIVYFIYTMVKPTKIESKTKIVPEIKLVIKDNKVDTLYVYKKK